MTALAHPAWPCVVGGLLVPVLPRGARPAIAVGAPALALTLALALPDGTSAGGSVLGLALTWLRVDPLGRMFAVIFALFGVLAGLYAAATPRPRLLAGGLVATGAALGIALAGDWVSLYAAWEALAVASWVLISDGGTRRAEAAGLRYLFLHALGGALLLAGLVATAASGSLPPVGPMAARGPGLLLLSAFAVNAAIPPLHAWLTDAYPESSPAGSVYLSAFATKAAVYALLRVFPGTGVLVPLGVAMALYGVILAIIENDIRRLLGYHIVSQVGYMVAGVGLGTPLALAGAAAHAFCHILYKGLLLMGAGAVVHATGRRRLTDLGGLGRAMPATLALYLVGALAISGAPTLNGFVSKSMIVDAAAQAGRPFVFWLLLLAAVGTFLSVGLKLPWLTFAGRSAPSAVTPGPVPRPMLIAMAGAGGLCLLTGVVPGLVYGLLPGGPPGGWIPYTTSHVLESLQLLVGTAIVASALRGSFAGPARVTLDADRLYRVLGRVVSGPLARVAARAAAGLERGVLTLTGPRLAAGRPGPRGSAAVGLLAMLVALGLLLIVLGVG